MEWEKQQKQAGAPSVPFSDPATESAAASPVPQTVIGTKPAPGLQGPKGLASRTNYSRVNTGAPPVADAGASKSLPPDLGRSLPEKVAEEVSMSGTPLTPRMTIQEMIKAAAAGSHAAAAVSDEALRQLGRQEPDAAEKVASQSRASAQGDDTYSTEYVDKLASAVEYINETQKEAFSLGATTSGVGPGQGPNALHVMQAESSEKNIDAGQQGKATPAHIPPTNPALQKDPSRHADPGTGLETNDSMKHKEQPVKVSSAPISLIRKLAGDMPPQFQKKDEKEPEKKDEKKEPEKKEASAVDPRLVDYVLSAKTKAGEGVKVAEDAINPAQISAGPAVPPETSAAGEQGGSPAGGQPQGPTSLVGSNDAAINYTKGEAKAPVKSDLGKVLTEPALSAAHDRTLAESLDNTSRAGVKISSATKTAAARAVLEKLAENAVKKDDKDEKIKKSQGGGVGTFQPPPVGGAAGGAM